MTFTDGNNWRDIPDGILQQDQQQTTAQQWGAGARAEVAQLWGDAARATLPISSDSLTNPLGNPLDAGAASSPAPATPEPTSDQSSSPSTDPTSGAGSYPPVSSITTATLAPPIAASPISAPVTQTTVGLSGGSGNVGTGDSRQQTLGTIAAKEQQYNIQPGIAQAVGITEGALVKDPNGGDIGDHGMSFGPFQFYMGGQLANFAKFLGTDEKTAGQYARDHPDVAIDWALRPGGYLGDTIRRGQQLGLSGADLATYAQRNGQVSVTPERAGQNFTSLMNGAGPVAPSVGGPDLGNQSTVQPTQDTPSPLQGAGNAIGTAVGGVKQQASNLLGFLQSLGREPTEQELSSYLIQQQQADNQANTDAGNVLGSAGSAIGAAAGQGGPLNPRTGLASGLLTAGEQAIGQNVVKPVISALTPGGALDQGRQALGGAIANASPNTPVLGGVLQAAGGVVGGPSVLAQLGTIGELSRKYGGSMTKMPDLNTMTPDDRQRWDNAVVAVGGIVGEPGAQYDQFGVQKGFTPTAAKAPPPEVRPTLEPEVAATLPPGSGPLAAALPEQPASTALTGLQNVARQRGILPAEPPEAFQGGVVQTPEQLTQKLRALTAQVTGGEQPPLTVGGKLPPPTELQGPTGPQPGQIGFDFATHQPTMESPGVGTFEPPNTANAPQTPAEADALRRALTARALQTNSPLPDIPYQGPSPNNLNGKPSAPFEWQNRANGQAQAVLPGVKLSQPVSPWDFVKAGRMGSLAGGVQTITHIALNVPVQAVLKLSSDLLSHPEAVGTEAYGAIQGIRTWAMSAWPKLVEPGQLAQKLGGGTGARVTEGALEGLVKTHQTLSNLAGDLIGNSELWQQAAIRAEAEGFSRLDVLSGKANGRIAELVANPTPTMRAAAQSAANRAALQGPMGTTGTAIARLMQSAPVAKFIVPFFNKGYHIASQGQELLPTGMLGTAYDVARAGVKQGPYSGPAGFAGRGAADAVTPLAQRLRNHLIGLGLMAEAYAQASGGNVTGDGPADPQAKSDLMDQGWRPDSVRIGGRYIDSHILGPVGWALTAGANAFEATHTGDQGGYAKAGSSFWDQAGDVMAREGRYFENETFLKSLGSLLQLVGSSAQQGKVAASEAANVASGLIPQGALLSNIATAADPFNRKVQSGDIGQQLASRLPGTRQQLPPRLSGTGQPLPNSQQGAGVLLPRSSVTNNDPVLAAFSAAGQTIPNAPSSLSLKGIPIHITPNEQYAWEQQRGQLLNSIVAGTVNDPRFRAMSQPDRRVVLNKLLAKADEAAGKLVIGQMSGDDLRARWTEGQQQAQRQAIPGPDYQMATAAP